ncbi:MAG: RNA-binding transcriptional accessory protein [Calditrichales bacterium]|nr:MAG: RNA-binding transcriptional accessory protein [Calditrichales bacterium]
MKTDQELFQLIASELSLKAIQVSNTVEMLDDGQTVPFISRYRKEKTGSLDEEQIRKILERIKYLRVVEIRRETILNSIEEQGKLTPELKEKIEAAVKLQDLEDLYLPYRPKKKTRASVAKEKGLEPLAQIIMAQELMSGDPLEVCAQYINTEKEVNSAEEALSGAMDILAEIISEEAELRKELREMIFQKGFIRSSSRGETENREYEMYMAYEEPIRRIPPHRILAINRGENESVLRVELDLDLQTILPVIETKFITNRQCIFHEILQTVVKDSYARLIAPAIHRDIRNQLTEKSEEHAIKVFSVNLRNLLMQPPIQNKRIIGIDPGFRTGCKVAVIDQTGKYLEGKTIFPHPPQKKYYEAKSTVRELIEKYDTDIVAIGNGTASRETEFLVAELIQEISDEREVVYIIVSEAGASVYSASDVARDEFPELEASMRGNISIARRLQDPLAELVKIDPQSIGVGLYQHDINQRELASALDDVVESCVNQVGVDLNTASKSLLTHISGLNRRSAERIVKYREQVGAFKNREELKKVDGIGEVAFEQAAGFLRIIGGENPLDATSIHPESYTSTQKLLEKYQMTDIRPGDSRLRQIFKQEKIAPEKIAEEIGCGIPTLMDILTDLEKPGRDPRDEMPKPVFRQDILKMEDLREGMILKGTVRNVVDFGAFVDIGVKQDGLVHISNMTSGYIKSPHEFIHVGDVIDVKVVSVDIARERIALSMKT